MLDLKEFCQHFNLNFSYDAKDQVNVISRRYVVKELLNADQLHRELSKLFRLERRPPSDGTADALKELPVIVDHYHFQGLWADALDRVKAQPNRRNWGRVAALATLQLEED